MKFVNLAKLLVLVVLFLLTKNLSAQSSEKSLADFNLKGKVKRIVANEYPVDDKEDSKKRKIELTFDAKGNKLTEMIYADNGSWLYKSKMEYNKNGLVSVEYYSNKLTFFDNMVKKYAYDKNNRISQTKLYDKYKHLISTVTYTYNDDGLLALTVNVNDVKKELERMAYVYNEGKQLVEERSLNPQDTVVSFVRYEYDENGRKKLKSEYDKNGFKDFTVEYTYDENGNVLTENSGYTNGQAILIEYVYTYDDNQNWIRVREKMNGTSYAVTVRDIEMRQ